MTDAIVRAGAGDTTPVEAKPDRVCRHPTCNCLSANAYRVGYAEGAARAAAGEREHIRQLAIRRGAVCFTEPPDDYEPEVPFADLLAAPPGDTP